MQDPTLFQSIRSQGFPEQQEQVIKCPRCDSTNTKFCYYNNYNLSQPRHFCKNCKRYWTKGGTLRNIPIGGGSRKNTKRSSSSKRSPATSSSSPTASPAAGSSDPTRIQPDPIGGGFKSSLLSSSPTSFSSSGDVGWVMEGVNRNGLGLETAKGGDFDGNLGSGEEGFVDPGSEMQRNDGGDLSCWNSGNEWSNLAMYTTPGARFR